MDAECWLLLGEAISKIDHIAGVPLQPDLADELSRIYLSKGAHATTQIEGNTLTEEQVRRRVDHDLDLPASQEYLGQEIDNVVSGYNLIVNDVVSQKIEPLTADRIRRFNELVLQGLEPADDHAVPPGHFRYTSVVVGSYRGAPAEDCTYLIDRLCDWLAELRSEAKGSDYERPVAILSAILAHLYIAWIHPFEDGNGRTSRLVEYQLLSEAGAPVVAGHVLADHYNRTRSAYYRELNKTSREPYSLTGLIKYALRGFVDGLRQQIIEVQRQQLGTAWHNFVYEVLNKDTPAVSRQRKLLLALPPKGVPKANVRTLNGELGQLYANKDEKTVSRDINALEKEGLLMKQKRGVITTVRPRHEIMFAFMSPTARTS
ncbi:Fic family protein [Streptomyces sp. NPDC088915]|uniref:Fic family protein n=1 Tax=Streptomyces sp. NPDC088915 TaxID=3365912 RepID=UPI00380321E4